MSSSPGGSGGFDFSKLSRGTQVAGVAAIILLISFFLPWTSFKVSILGQSDSTNWNGSEFLLGWLALLCAILVLVVIGLELFAPQVTLPAAPSLIILVLGAIAIFCTGWHVLFLPDEADQANDLANALNEAAGDAAGDAGSSFDAGRGWGVFVALIAAIGVTAGGYLRLNND
jgi:hypothetical protein